MLNEVKLIGRLGSDPETRYTASQDPVTTISLATTERWKDKNGDRKEETTWHRVVFFKGLAKIASEYLRKGGLVYVSGRIKNEKYQKDGVYTYSTSIIAEDLKMLDGKSDASARQSAEQPKQQAAAADSYDDFDDDILF